MKTLDLRKVVVSVVFAAVLSSTSALADSDTEYRCGHGPYYQQGMMGQGYGMMGQGYGMHGQGYGMMGPGMMGQGYGMQGQGYSDRDYEPIPEAKARKMIDQYLKDNLKGFEIVKLDKQRVPMGILYWAIVKDKNGNEFELHLNPWGYIRGPFVR